VYGHLVAVEVGVEGGAYHRVKLDSRAFDQHGLESLDGESVQEGARLSSTKYDLITSSSTSHTLGLTRSTNRLALLMLWASPFSPGGA
jgi:hypothetical protein